MNLCCDACGNLGLSESVRLVLHLYSLRNEANVARQRRFGITSQSEQLGIVVQHRSSRKEQKMFAGARKLRNRSR